MLPRGPEDCLPGLPELPGSLPQNLIPTPQRGPPEPSQVPFGVPLVVSHTDFLARLSLTALSSLRPQTLTPRSSVGFPGHGSHPGPASTGRPLLPRLGKRPGPHCACRGSLGHEAVPRGSALGAFLGFLPVAETTVSSL